MLPKSYPEFLINKYCYFSVCYRRYDSIVFDSIFMLKIINKSYSAYIALVFLITKKAYFSLFNECSKNCHNFLIVLKIK